ncbi:hypothetical protein V1281_004708 [Nitrobacteraceae bacterium AZCC 2161]
MIQLLIQSAKLPDTSMETNQTDDAVQMSARATKDQIAAVARACEALSGSIDDHSVQSEFIERKNRLGLCDGGADLRRS